MTDEGNQFHRAIFIVRLDRDDVGRISGGVEGVRIRN
jgi:hypothetical protein